jgi:hypothetical protein
MQTDSPAALSAARPRDRDVDRWGFFPSARTAPADRQHAPELGGAAMAQRGALSASQHRRDPSPVIADVRVADGVDPAMDAVEAAGGDPALDRAGIDARGIQLRR